MQLLSSPFSRRYTPPTCTLEVTGLTSALSRWAGRPLLKNLQFQLSLEDPRQPGDQPIQLRGDRSALETLAQTVEAYVQDFLNQSPTGLNPRLELPQETALPEGEPSPGSATPEKSRFLRPQSLLSHSFVPGALRAEASTSPIALSVTQLFDLATALEEYSAEAVSLPALSQTPASRLAGIPLWARAAAIVVAAAGLSIAALELFSPSSTQLASQKSSNPSQSPSQSSPGKLLVPSPPELTNPTSPATLGSPTPLPFTSPPAIPTPAPLPDTPPAAPEANSPANPSAPAAPGQRIAIQPKAATKSTSALKPPPLPPEADTPTVAAAENSTAASAPSTEKLADTIPQVAEVRSYFAQRWQPPAGLKQTLEYTLVLNPNGSLQRAVPLGQAASTYLDRTPIPLANEPFVSPPEGKRSALIRLVLQPNGKVETFLQPGN